MKEKKRLFISPLKIPFQPVPILEPEAAALTIVKAIERNKKMVSKPGHIYRFTRLGQAILSINVFNWFAGDVPGIYKTIEHFTGRKK